MVTPLRSANALKINQIYLSLKRAPLRPTKRLHRMYEAGGSDTNASSLHFGSLL
jgi:hypothetical protein